ncbi:hypothetical protein D3C72_1256630 [compost metagenome]
MATFSSKLPEAPAMVTVTWLPATCMPACTMTSAMVGLRLPGMIDEVSPSSGITSSPRPQFGPELIQRRSLAILMHDAAITFSTPDNSSRASCAAMPSTLQGLGWKGRPVRRATSAQNASAKPGGALSPVPAAVPPCGSISRRGRVASMRAMPCPTWAAKPSKLRPSVVGTASIRWVRASFRMSAKSVARAWRLSRRAASAGSSRSSSSSTALRCITVGKLSFDDCERLT